MENKQNQTGSNPEPAVINVMLVDDHPLYRDALKGLLEKQDDLRVIAEASDGDEAVRIAADRKPDVVIMDIGMPRMNGLEATREIKSLCPSTNVLVLTVHDDSEHVLGIFEAGASGYFVKSVVGDDIVRAIHSVVAGETVLSSEVFQKLLKHALKYPSKPVTVERGDVLTVRELEIVKLAAKGFSNKEIADLLQLSLRTVKSYLVSIYPKLQVSSRTEAVIVALRTGIITMNDLG